MNLLEQTRRKRTRVTASALALLLGSSAALVACGNEPDDNTVARLLPQSTFGFVSAAISPSNKQKVSLFALSKHFPKKVQTDKADKVRDQLLAELFNGSSLKYDDDIKPWLGSEAAFAVMPGYGTDHVPVVVGAVKQTDEKKAKAALDKAKQEADTYRFIDDYVFFVEKDQIKGQNATKALDDIEAVSKKSSTSLQNNKRFQDNLGTLHGEHLVIGWVDTPVAAREGIAAAKANKSTTDALASNSSIYNSAGLGALSGLGSSLSKNSKTTDDLYAKVQQSADEVGAFSFELYATTNTFVLEGVSEKEPKTVGTGIEKKIFNSLPNDTLAAATTSNLGKSLHGLLDELKKDQTGSQPAMGEFQPTVDKLVNSLGNEGTAFMHDGDPLSGGVVAELTDANAAQSAVDELINKIKPSGLVAIKDFNVTGGKAYDLQQQTFGASNYSYDAATGQYVITPKTGNASGPHVFIGIANNRLSITNNGDQLKAVLAGNGDLASQPGVKKALNNETVVFGAIYVNIEQAVALAQKHGTTIDGDSGDWWKAMDVYGSQSWVKNGHYHVELHLGMK